MRTTDSRSAEPQMAERQEAAQFAAVSHHCDVTGSGDIFPHRKAKIPGGRANQAQWATNVVRPESVFVVIDTVPAASRYRRNSQDDAG